MALVLGTNCGFVTTAPTDDPTGQDTTTADTIAMAIKVTGPANAIKVTEIGWWCNNATQEANFEVGLYTHDSPNNEPESLLAGTSRTNAKGTDAGWKKATGLNITITEGTIYWIAIQLDDTATTTWIDYHSMAGARFVRKLSQYTLPTTWGASSNKYDNYIEAIYAVYETEEAEGTNIKVNVGDAWKEVSAIKVNVDDTWKEVTSAKVNVGDAWKTVF